MSFRIGLKAKDVAAARFVQVIQEAIVAAFLKRQKDSKLKKADIARRLEVDRAQISRWLGSPADMTLKSAGYMVWALGGRFKVSIELEGEARPVLANAIATVNCLDDDVIRGEITVAGNQTVTKALGFPSGLRLSNSSIRGQWDRKTTNSLTQETALAI